MTVGYLDYIKEVGDIKRGAVSGWVPDIQHFFNYLGYKLKPDGMNTQQINTKNTPEENWSLKEAKKTTTFRVLNFSVGLSALYITALSFHIVSIFETAGFSETIAVSIFIPASVIAVLTTSIRAVSYPLSLTSNTDKLL